MRRDRREDQRPGAALHATRPTLPGLRDGPVPGELIAEAQRVSARTSYATTHQSYGCSDPEVDARDAQDVACVDRARCWARPRLAVDGRTHRACIVAIVVRPGEIRRTAPTA